MIFARVLCDSGFDQFDLHQDPRKPPEEANNQLHSIINWFGFKSKPLEVIASKTLAVCLVAKSAAVQRCPMTTFSPAHRLAESVHQPTAKSEMRFPCKAISWMHNARDLHQSGQTLWPVRATLSSIPSCGRFGWANTIKTNKIRTEEETRKRMIETIRMRTGNCR